MLSPRPFAEEMDASPGGEGEKTINPVLKKPLIIAVMQALARLF
jgi:hypothetical protein